MRTFFYRLLIASTDKLILQMLRYCLVGGIAFVADNGSYWVFTRAGVHYMLSAVISFIIGLTVNYALSKILVFKKETARTGTVGEFMVYGLIGAAGLGITELILWLLTGVLNMKEMIAKLIASVVTLIWNFAARKIILYKEM